MTHLTGRKLLTVRDYLAHEGTMNYCAAIPYTDGLMSVIQMFAAAGLAFYILSCPFNFVFCPLEPTHL